MYEMYDTQIYIEFIIDIIVINNIDALLNLENLNFDYRIDEIMHKLSQSLEICEKHLFLSFLSERYLSLHTKYNIVEQFNC